MNIGKVKESYYVGPEVEHTPAFSKKTLFVVGKQSLDQIEIIAREYKTPHIFMGANRSFNAASEDLYWDQVITALLDRGFWVTLEYQAHEHETVLQMLNPGVWQCRTFIPVLNVRIPRIQSSNPNLTVKIDDVNFNSTNAGVWCLHHHEVTDSNRFTDWNEYIDIEPVDPISGPSPNPTLRVPIQVSADMKETIDNKNLEETDIKNNSKLGLDPLSGSQLKPELSAEKLETPESTLDAAKAYAGNHVKESGIKNTVVKEVKKAPTKKE